MPTTTSAPTTLTSTPNPAAFHYIDLVAQLTLTQMHQRKNQRQSQLHSNAR